MSAPKSFDFAYTNDQTSPRGHGVPKEVVPIRSTMSRNPTLFSQATPYVNMTAPKPLRLQQGARSTAPLTLAQMLALPAEHTKKPKVPIYLDIENVPRIRDMPAAQLDQSTDAELIIHLVRSGAIEDDGYVWADASELHKWLTEELIKRLNHLFNVEVRRLPNDISTPALIREIKGLRQPKSALVKWCKKKPQRSIDFRAFRGLAERLERFDLERELSVRDIMTLIDEAWKRIHTPVGQVFADPVPTGEKQFLQQLPVAHAENPGRKDDMHNKQGPVLADKAAFSPQPAGSLLASKQSWNYQPTRRSGITVFRDEPNVAAPATAAVPTAAALRGSTNLSRTPSSLVAVIKDVMEKQKKSDSEKTARSEQSNSPGEKN